MKQFIVWDKDGNVATTEINPLESTTSKSSNVSLHIMYSAKAIYSVHATSWLKGSEVIPADLTAIAKCEPVMSGTKIVGLQNDVFYVGPERAATKTKKTAKSSPASEVQSAGDATPAFA